MFQQLLTGRATGERDPRADAPDVRAPKTREIAMGLADKAKNKAQTTKGSAKKAAGDATGNDRLRAEGKADKVSGNLKNAGEKVKDAFKK
jgi:uncharacterized protein YjbJ (UPF0337 family)